MDLEQAIDYCRQYDVEPEFATLTYIEKLLLQLPIGHPSGCILGIYIYLYIYIYIYV
jgi:hypothetical protein